VAFALVLPLDPQSWGILVPVSVSANVAQELTGSLLLTLLLTTEGAVYRSNLAIDFSALSISTFGLSSAIFSFSISITVPSHVAVRTDHAEAWDFYI